MNSRTLVLVVSTAAVLGGCQQEAPETTTRGRLEALVAESAAPALFRQANAFQSLYGSSGAELTAKAVPSRAALDRFVLDTARLVISALPLSHSQDSLVRQLHGDITALPLAYDAVVVCVSKNNPATKITTKEIAAILLGVVRRWEELGNAGGKRGPITVCLQDSSDVEAYLSYRVLDRGRLLVRPRTAPDGIAILDAVRSDPGAIGFVGLSWLDSAKTPVKQLEVAETGVRRDTLSAMPPEALGKFYSPHPANIYRAFYPLRRTLFLYVRRGRPDLATGFGTFVASAEGQRILLEAGLVPGTQPIRLRPSP